MDAVVFLLPAFAACLVLASIHVYLGVHVVARGVIFVDLALAQVAALGALAAVAHGHEPGSSGAYLGSLAAACAGAAVLAATARHRRSHRVPHEAIIGIVYAVAASAVVVLAAKLPHGTEEIERMLVGQILWVSWPTVARTALLYAALGAVHFGLRRPFLAISEDPAAAARGRRPWLLDFAFYATFAVAITASVAIAGVLLVFAFLVVPATAGALVADRLRDRLLVGWAVAVAASLLGLGASWALDLPTGATIVSAFGLVLVLVAAGRVVARRG